MRVNLYDFIKKHGAERLVGRKVLKLISEVYLDDKTNTEYH